MAVQLAVFFPVMAPPSSSHSGALSEKPFLAGWRLSSFLPVAAGKSTKQRCDAIMARRLSGLEEAIRIRRLRELQGTTKVRKRPPLKRGKISGPLSVPDHIAKPLYVGSNQLPELSSEYQIHDDDGITGMRAACELAARVLDFAGTMVRGYHGDTSKTFLCGKVNESTERLVKVTEECLDRAIAVCKDGASFKKIGKRISEVAERYGFGVVERFVGHGIGTVFHSEPIVMHHRNEKSGSMVEGQTFTMEPILTMGTIDCVTWDDGWTTLTADGRPAAQFEHTVLITRTGAEVLTKC